MTINRDRWVWIDIAKTFAIALVVLGHVWRGLNNAGLISNGTLYTQIDNAIYYFHMPLFFMISGFLFLKGSQDTWKNLWRKQAKYIIWPYFLWSITSILIKFIVDSKAGNDSDLSGIYKILYEPVAVFWFLYVLFIFQNVLKILFQKTHSILLVLLLGSVLNIASYFPEFKNFTVLHHSSYYIIFFMIGFSAAKLNLIDRLEIKPKFAFWAVILFILTQLGCLFSHIDLFSVMATFVGLLLTFCVFSVCLYLENLKSMTSGFIAFVSSATLAIYVAHTIFTAATRMALVSLGGDNLIIHILAGSAVGLTIPLIGFYLAQKLRLSPLVGFGPNKKLI